MRKMFLFLFLAAILLQAGLCEAKDWRKYGTVPGGFVVQYCPETGEGIVYKAKMSYSSYWEVWPKKYAVVYSKEGRNVMGWKSYIGIMEWVDEQGNSEGVSFEDSMLATIKPDPAFDGGLPGAYVCLLFPEADGNFMGIVYKGILDHSELHVIYDEMGDVFSYTDRGQDIRTTAQFENALGRNVESWIDDVWNSRVSVIRRYVP